MSKIYVRIKTPKGAKPKYAELDESIFSRFLFEKHGRDYVPTHERFDTWDYWREGRYVVVVSPNGRTRVNSINPSKDEFVAAVTEKRDEICRVVNEVLKMRPARKLVTPAQQKAWKAFNKAMGNDRWVCEFGAVQEIVDKVMEVLCR